LALALADSAVVDAGALARALRSASDLAYQAVVHPVEGTILTVASAAAQAARCAVVGASAGAGQEAEPDVATVLAAAVEAADEALARTPEQLDVLARAGVVDAGGQGLVLVLGALLAVVDPTAPDEEALLGRWGLGQGAGAFVHAPRPTGRSLPDGAFEVMYLLDADDDAVPDLRLRLDRIGASVVVVGGGGLWNVHVHTDDAGPAVEAGVAVGHVSRIRITPLVADVADVRTGEGPETSGHGRPVRVVVAVASGPPLAALFESVGARVVRGTAGDRPTPGSLVAAAEGAAEVLLLPNDDAHRGVAETAASELRARGVTVAVLPTRAAVQGLAALAVHEAGLPFTDDLVAMSAAAGATRHGAVTRAEREAITSAGICQPGDVLGLVEGDIAIIGSDPAETVCGVVDRMLSAGGELVTLVCGDDPWPGNALAEAVRQHLHRTRLDVEIVVYDGGQPLYPLLVGVE
jgi:DAK2 domain fusion protein YloV